MRAALQHLAGNPDFGLAGVVARVLTTAARVRRDAAGLLSICLVPGRVPVAGPFPHVADHVVDAVAVRRECGHWRGAIVPVKLAILVRKRSLPSVRHLLAAGCEFVAPGKLCAIEPTTGSELP